MNTPLTLCIESDHGINKFVTLARAPSRKALSVKVSETNVGSIDTGCDFTPSGKVCSQSAELLRAYRADGEWVGVIIMTIRRDV